MMDVSKTGRTRLSDIAPNKHLKISLSMIYYMGMWPSGVKYRYLYGLYTVLSFIYLLGIFLATEIAYLIVSWGSMEKIVAGATILMTNITHACKVLFILHRHKRIQNLVDVTESEMFSRDNAKYRCIVTRYTWQGIFHHIAYQSFGGMAVFTWGFTPIANLLTGRSKQLPMEGWYPYNVTNTPAFEITSLDQAITIIICCFNNVAIDTMITGLITIACCQLTILNQNIASINNETKRQSISKDIVDGKKCTEDSCHGAYKDLKRCVEHSNMIFDFSKEIQSIFGTAIFLQFLVNCIIICLIAFNIAQMKVYIPSILFGMVMYMCCMTYQIFIFCWHGNELYLHVRYRPMIFDNQKQDNSAEKSHLQSVNLIFASYSNEWWHKTKNFKRGIQIIMIRAQRPLILTAGNIMELSLQTFVRILRMSYSIFTVLQTSADA
ncbi:odorant receptor Or2-like isoform X1 [Hylaeus volcanicus]|uniref:odorant receptor Or2-like isoform X1 n=1 Tax=Hylaeus volcanicus TaxID=313075 RepID=UPI0023B82C86|nr:odorant receptor Or2-like isoform X1 [Hylaeus volcanicus]